MGVSCCYTLSREGNRTGTSQSCQGIYRSWCLGLEQSSPTHSARRGRALCRLTSYWCLTIYSSGRRKSACRLRPHEARTHQALHNIACRRHCGSAIAFACVARPIRLHAHRFLRMGVRRPFGHSRRRCSWRVEQSGWLTSFPMGRAAHQGSCPRRPMCIGCPFSSNSWSWRSVVSRMWSSCPLKANGFATA